MFRKWENSGKDKKGTSLFIFGREKIIKNRIILTKNRKLNRKFELQQQ